MCLHAMPHTILVNCASAIAVATHGYCGRGRSPLLLFWGGGGGGGGGASPVLTPVQGDT